MTTELEKQFFNTFGIEPNITGYELKQIKENARGLIRVPVSEYPQITDRHYLELMCLYVSTNDYFKCFADTEKINFRNQILEKYIANKRFFDKHQVQAIFEGER